MSSVAGPTSANRSCAIADPSATSRPVCPATASPPRSCGCVTRDPPTAGTSRSTWPATSGTPKPNYPPPSDPRPAPQNKASTTPSSSTPAPDTPPADSTPDPRTQGNDQDQNCETQGSSLNTKFPSFGSTPKRPPAPFAACTSRLGAERPFERLSCAAAANRHFGGVLSRSGGARLRKTVR